MEKMHAGTQEKEEGDAERNCSELTRTPVLSSSCITGAQDRGW